MSDLERRLEAALKAAKSDARREYKRLVKARLKTEDLVEKAKQYVRDLEIKAHHARRLEAEAAKKVSEDDKQKKLAGRIEYNYKVRNR